jgi:hypothetical protein
MELFEQATRRALRFESPKGALTVEDLWNLPLTSTTGKANLDGIAKYVNRQLKDADEESFVQPTVGSKNVELNLKFDVVKHIIAVRVAERDAAAEAEKRRATKQRILELIAEKQDDNLKGKTLEELQAMANSL